MKIQKYIDHTLLKSDAQEEQIHKLCMEAITCDFASVCVNSVWVAYCKELLKGHDVAVCTVIGFPLGAVPTKVKVFETEQALLDGADEIDMVIHIGALKAGQDQAVYEDVKAVVQAANSHCVKVILENCLLTKEEIKRACSICIKAGAAYVKTSTGFASGGAWVEDVRLMRNIVKDACKIKAAGGIRTYQDMMKMIDAGADRIGTSAGVALVKGKS